MDEMSSVASSPRQPGVIAIGTRSQEIVLYEIGTRQVVKRIKSRLGNVNEIRWNPGGEGMIMARHGVEESGGVRISMQAVEEGREVQAYEEMRSR